MASVSKPFQSCDVCGKQAPRDELKDWVLTAHGKDACGEECRAKGETLATKQAVRDAALDWAVSIVRK